MNILCIGDVVARPGREALKHSLGELRDRYSASLVIVNGENSAGGSGIDRKCFEELKGAGADIITLGDHTFRRPEVRSLLNDPKANCLCPGNYPSPDDVRGWCVVEKDGTSIGVLNLLGRTFLQTALDCPFRYAEQVLEKELSHCKVRIVDFHGEATSEKIAFAKHFDGAFSLVFGTHTHVQTADECILSGGTSFITDIGMTGSQSGVIGLDKEVAIKRFLTGMPSSYKPASGNPCIHGVCVSVDVSTGKATNIERVVEAVTL